MIGNIGKKSSEEELDKFRHNWKKGDKTGVLDYNYKRLITPEEFYTPGGPASLNWEELNYFHRRANGGNALVLYPGGFDGLLSSFCDELVDKGLMSKESLCEGDYYFLDVGGIKIYYPDGSDPHGRTAFSTRMYYPRIKADAEEYVKHFYGEAYPVYVSQIISLPNRKWDISKKK